jgi:hypothetical protein
VALVGIVCFSWLALLFHLAVTARRPVAVERGIAKFHEETDVLRRLSDRHAAPASQDAHGRAE